MTFRTRLIPCGEYGEFHSFVYDGPCFSRPVAIEVGETVVRDGRYYADLLPASARAARDVHGRRYSAGVKRQTASEQKDEFMNKRSAFLVMLSWRPPWRGSHPHPPNVTPIAAMALFGGTAFAIGGWPPAAAGGNAT